MEEQQFSNPHSSFDSGSSNDHKRPYSKKFSIVYTVLFLAAILSLKEFFERTTAVQMCEYIFIYSTVYTVFCLPYFAYYKRRYILDIEDKEAAMRLGQWLTLYYVVDFICLKLLPLLSRCAVVGFFLTEFNFKFQGYLRALHPVPRFRVHTN